MPMIAFVRWVIAAGVVAVGAVAVSAWTIAGSSGSGFATPQRAVLVTCHADAGRLMEIRADGLAQRADTVAVSWHSPGQSRARSWIATVDRAGSHNYKVLDCKKFAVIANFR